jgi:hypothetical protein
MANVKYNGFGKALAENDMTAVTIKGMFCDPSYTPDPDTEVFLSDISANRASGTTDFTVSNFTITVDNTDNRTEFDIDNEVTGAITVAAGMDAVSFYISTGTDSTSRLLTYNDILVGGVKTTVFPVAGTASITISTDGIFSV